jgi:hypothetical protein
MRARRTTPRERLLASTIDAKAYRLLVSGEKWRYGLLDFADALQDLTTEEHKFIVLRVAKWQFQISRLNGREDE